MSFNPELTTGKHAAKWDTYFLKLARHVSTQSQDRSTKCGCVFVRDKRIISTGYNGFPIGTEDYDNDDKHERPEKYLWFEHSERNAIYSAAKMGASLDGATAYITGPPCVDCTRGMIQSGIKVVVIPVKHNMIHRVVSGDKWSEQAKVCETMMKNAGVLYLSVEIDYERDSI